MKRSDFLEYEYNNGGYAIFYKNRNMNLMLQCIAYKYGIVVEENIGDANIKIPKMGQVKQFLCDRCNDYFGLEITKKQISSLLRPQRNRFPYTAILIIETIYNLLKEHNSDTEWIYELVNYLKKYSKCDLKYETFVFQKISEMICSSANVDKFMNTEYEEIYKCFIESRISFYKEFHDVSMMEHCMQDFPSKKFEKADIPTLMYKYQNNRIYFRR